jgi:hypothetical protein
MGAQKHYQKHFYKNIDKKSKTVFLSDFVLSRFWSLLGEGTSKTPKKISKKINLTLVLLWPLTHPPTTGVTDLFFAGRPLASDYRSERERGLGRQR